MAWDRYGNRVYRLLTGSGGLDCYRVTAGESDLFICTEGDLREAALQSLLKHRASLESYISSHPGFSSSFRPLPAVTGSASLVQDMAEAARIFNVGPMAAVAGAISQYVGTDLLVYSSQVIVENGGDIFSAGGVGREVRVLTGAKPDFIDIAINDTCEGIGLCTSSATVGPSISLGGADAVTVLAETATLADAAATAIGNMVRTESDIEAALEHASGFDCIKGVMVVIGGAVGVWGEVELIGGHPV